MSDDLGRLADGLRSVTDRDYPPEQVCACGRCASPVPLPAGQRIRCEFCPPLDDPGGIDSNRLKRVRVSLALLENLLRGNLAPARSDAPPDLEVVRVYRDRQDYDSDSITLVVRSHSFEALPSLYAAAPELGITFETLQPAPERPVDGYLEAMRDTPTPEPCCGLTLVEAMLRVRQHAGLDAETGPA